MTSKLSKQKREEIIINHIKGTPDPHYIVTESKNGRYTVKMKPFEIEEDEDEEPEEAEVEEDDQDVEVEIPKEQPRPRKQNARQRLEQLASMLPDDDEPPERSQRGWNRCRLRF